MDLHEPPQVSRLRHHRSVKLAMEVLSSKAYQEALDWLRDHFTFNFNQQIEWSDDPDVATGEISDLNEPRLLHLLQAYGVEPSRQITILWAYGDIGMKLPVSLVAKYINDIWLPVNDDVFLFDMKDVWCLELHHEGAFSCGRYYPSHYEKLSKPATHDEVDYYLNLILDDQQSARRELVKLEHNDHARFIEVCHQLLQNASLRVKKLILLLIGQYGDKDDHVVEKVALEALTSPDLQIWAWQALKRAATIEAVPALQDFLVTIPQNTTRYINISSLIEKLKQYTSTGDETEK